MPFLGKIRSKSRNMNLSTLKTNINQNKTASGYLDISLKGSYLRNRKSVQILEPK